MFIRSERLFLRPYWPEDRAELLALAEGADNSRLPLRSGWPSIAEIEPCEPQDRRCPRFLVTLPGAQDTRIVGFVGIGRVTEMFEAGLWIAPAFRGRGFATEAGRALLSVARALGLRSVSARIAFLDDSARKLLTKLRFEQQGEIMVRVLDEPCGGGDSPVPSLAA